MVKGMYHYLRSAWKKPDMDSVKSSMIQWRRGNAVEVIEKPSRLDRARALGYKAKKGIVMVRVRVKRGGRKRQREGVKGRKSRKQTNRKTLKMNYKWIAEIRASRKFDNLEALNSYWIGQDGKYYFYEVIMVDASKPEIKSDRTLNWIADKKHSKRAERGLTSAAKKSRGLRSRNPEMKVRGSLRAHGRKGK